eukprot:767990-Hanusia_phi.AAC.6
MTMTMTMVKASEVVENFISACVQKESTYRAIYNIFGHSYIIDKAIYIAIEKTDFERKLTWDPSQPHASWKGRSA